MNNRQIEALNDGSQTSFTIDNWRSEGDWVNYTKIIIFILVLVIVILPLGIFFVIKVGNLLKKKIEDNINDDVQ